MSVEGFDQIYWHDCEIESAVEIPSQDMLALNVQYPENWEQNCFVPGAIIFSGYHPQEVHEMPFEGNPTILRASVEAENRGTTTVRIETNAGFRLVTAKTVSVSETVSI